MAALGRYLSLLLVLGMLPACANATRRGQALYVEGRLIEAAEVFEHGEWHLARISNGDRVRYGLYRGATLLELGDLRGAARWLYFAQRVENRSPGSLEPSDVQTLRLALRDLDRRWAMLKPSVDPLTDAMADAGPPRPNALLPAESSAATPRPTTPSDTVVAPGQPRRPLTAQ